MIIKLNNPKFQKAISRLGSFNLESGPWIAGGVVRKLWQNADWSSGDIDIFFSSDSQMRDMVTHITNTFHYNGNKSENSVTWKIKKHLTGNWFEQLIPRNGEYIFQGISKFYSNNINELFSQFDFTVCQFATDGNYIITTEDAIKDTIEKRIHSPSNNITASRIMKYATYGFSPSLSDLKTAINHTIYENVALGRNVYD